MRTFLDILTLLVMFGAATLVAVGAGWYLSATGRNKIVRSAGPLLAVINVLTLLGYWYFWGKGFDYSDVNRIVPGWVALGEKVALTGCVVTTVLVSLLAVSAAARRDNISTPQRVDA